YRWSSRFLHDLPRLSRGPQGSSAPLEANREVDATAGVEHVIIRHEVAVGIHDVVTDKSAHCYVTGNREVKCEPKRIQIIVSFLTLGEMRVLEAVIRLEDRLRAQIITQVGK